MWTSISPWCKAARERERHGRLAAAGALNVMLLGEALGDVQAAWGPVVAGGLPGKVGGLSTASVRPTLHSSTSSSFSFRGDIENKHWTDVASIPPPPLRVVCKYEQSPSRSIMLSSRSSACYQ
jgi:hypothetical protein